MVRATDLRDFEKEKWCYDSEGNIGVNTCSEIRLPTGESLPVFFRLSGVGKFFDADTVSTPGTEQTLISHTVSVGKNIDLVRLEASCRQSGTFRILVDGSQVGKIRVGPGFPNGDFRFEVLRNASSGVTIEVKFLAPTWVAASDINAHLMTLEKDN